MPSPILPVVAVIVVVAIAGVDRLLAVAAARRIAVRIALASKSDAAPVVRIGGIAFLPQLLAGRFRRIEITLGACTLDGIGLSSLAARLAAVRAPLLRLLAGDDVLAGQLAATAVVPLSALTSRLPAGLTLRLDDDDLRISGTIGLVPVFGTLGIKVDPRKIVFTPKLAGVSAPIGFAIGAPELRPEFAITAVRVTSDGLEVVVRGIDVRLPGDHQRPG